MPLLWALVIGQLGELQRVEAVEDSWLNVGIMGVYTIAVEEAALIVVVIVWVAIVIPGALRCFQEMWQSGGPES